MGRIIGRIIKEAPSGMDGAESSRIVPWGRRARRGAAGGLQQRPRGYDRQADGDQQNGTWGLACWEVDLDAEGRAGGARAVSGSDIRALRGRQVSRTVPALRRPAGRSDCRRRIASAAARTICFVPSRVTPPSSALIASTSAFEPRSMSYAESFAWTSPWRPKTASMNSGGGMVRSSVARARPP